MIVINYSVSRLSFCLICTLASKFKHLYGIQIYRCDFGARSSPKLTNVLFLNKGIMFVLKKLVNTPAKGVIFILKSDYVLLMLLLLIKHKRITILIQNCNLIP